MYRQVLEGSTDLALEGRHLNLDRLVVAGRPEAIRPPARLMASSYRRLRIVWPSRTQLAPGPAGDTMSAGEEGERDDHSDSVPRGRYDGPD